MAEFRIVVVVDPSGAQRGAKQTERALNNVGTSADRTRRLIQRAFAFAGVTAGLRQLIQVADTFQNLQNRIRTVTDGTAQLNAVTEELFNISNRTRSSFQATTEVYARTALAVRELGISQQQTLQFAESLNQAVILSGASAMEANAGMIQLSQGLASGTLRGDELRSVLEQLPVVADVISKELGITRGALRELGQEGKITADIVLRAFANAREELEERFGEVVPTIGQSFQVLKNQFVGLVGAFNEGSGAARGLSKSILFLADNLDTLVRAATAAGIALGVVLAGQGLKSAVLGVRALTVAIATNPLGALAVAAIAVTSALIAFSDQIQVGGDRIANLQDLGLAFFETFQRGLKVITELFVANFGSIGEIFGKTFSDVEFSVEGVLRVTARVIDGVVGAFKGGANAIPILFENIPASLELIFVEGFNLVLRNFTEFFNTIIRGINLVAKAAGGEGVATLKAFQLEAGEEAKAIGERIDQSIADGIASQDSAERALDGILTRADQIATERIAQQKATQDAIDEAKAGLAVAGPRIQQEDPKFQKILTDLAAQGELLKLNNQEREIQAALLKSETKLKRELTVAEAALVEAQLRTNQGLADERKLLDELRGPLQEYERSLMALNRLSDDGAISTEEFARKQGELRLAALESATDLKSGVERGLLKISEAAGDTAAQAEQALMNAFQGAEDALFDFVKTGKLDFAGLVDSIESDLIRLALRGAIIKPLADLLGLGAGGGGSGGGLGGLISAGIGALFGGSPAPGMASGGSMEIAGRGGVDNNVLSVNNKPVARVSKGETLSVSPNGGGRERPIQINFKIETPDADSFQRSQGQILSRTETAMRRAARRK